MVGEEGETREHILGLGNAHGYDVNNHKLTRWRHEGLLQRPDQRSLGRGYGTQTVYPLGTGKQLLALCTIHANERRLDHVAWHLWWADYEVSLETIRRFIAAVVAEWDKQVQEFIDPETGELSESAWKLVDEVASKRLFRPLNGIRKRVRKKWFDTFIRVLLEALVGRFERFPDEPKKGNVQDDERHIVEKGLRLEQADAGPWPKINIETCLKEIGWLTSKGSLQRELGYLTDEELIEARSEVRSWLALLGGYSLMFERWLGEWGPFRFVSMMGQIVRDIGAQEQALFTLVWAIGRFRGPADLREGLVAHGKPPPEMEAGLRDWEHLERLREEAPALSKILTPERIKAGFKAAFQGPQQLKRFEEELEEVSRQVAETEK